jgi:hypothetical protein
MMNWAVPHADADSLCIHRFLRYRIPIIDMDYSVLEYTQLITLARSCGFRDLPFSVDLEVQLVVHSTNNLGEKLRLQWTSPFQLIWKSTHL